jgi:hypothetical protein
MMMILTFETSVSVCMEDILLLQLKYLLHKEENNRT